MTKIVKIDNGFLLVSDTGDHSLTHYLDSLPDPVVEAIKKQNEAEKAAAASLKTGLVGLRSDLADSAFKDQSASFPVLTQTLSQAA